MKKAETRIAYTKDSTDGDTIHLVTIFFMSCELILSKRKNYHNRVSLTSAGSRYLIYLTIILPFRVPIE